MPTTRLLVSLLLGSTLLFQCALTSDDTRPAELVHRNVEVLRGVPAHEFDRLMHEYNRVLGVECEHCHVPETWHDESKPAFSTARDMILMVGELNTNHLAEFGGVTCWTCHAGSTRPERMHPELLDAEERRWPAELASVDEGVRITMCVYDASLGVGCDHCHATGDWRSHSKRAFGTTAVMESMFEVFPKYMPKGARTQCYMCHKGNLEPER